MIATAEILRQVRDPDPAVRERAVRAGAALLPDDALVGHLRNGTDHVLRNAALEMLKARGTEAYPLAVALLDDPDADVVLQAVLLLDYLRDPRAALPLRSVLRHRGANVVQAAIVALGRLGNAAVLPDLVPFLKSDPWLRMAAIVALGDLRCAEAVEPLRAMLDDELLSGTAAESLARVGGREPLELLAARWVAHQNDVTLLELVAHVLEGFAGPLPQLASFGIALEVALVASSPSGRLAAARCLLALGKGPQDQAALQLVADAGSDVSLPACLLRRGDLAAGLLEGNGMVFGWGLRLAALHPAAVSPHALLKAMEQVRGHLHADALGEALAAAEPQDPAFCTRLVALYARLPKDLRPQWGHVLRRHRSGLRTALLDASLADAATRVVLLTVVEENPRSAAAAIGALPSVVRPEALAHATLDAALLKALPWPKLLEEDPDECGRIAVSVCERAGLAQHIEAVRALARKHGHRELVRLLGRLKDAASVPLLIELAAGGPDTVRPFALAALGAIGGADARAALRDRAAETTWARFAYRALADCRTEADLPVFRLAASHADWHVRMISAEVLAASRHAEDARLLAGLAADAAQAVADRARSGMMR